MEPIPDSVPTQPSDVPQFEQKQEEKKDGTDTGFSTNAAFYVCTCSDTQVCHLCPESKKRRLLRELNIKTNAKPSRREMKKIRSEVRYGIEKRIGRRLTNQQFDDLITAKAHEVKLAHIKELTKKS